jgi:hypothetical protein
VVRGAGCIDERVGREAAVEQSRVTDLLHSHDIQ